MRIAAPEARLSAAFVESEYLVKMISSFLNPSAITNKSHSAVFFWTSVYGIEPPYTTLGCISNSLYNDGSDSPE